MVSTNGRIQRGIRGPYPNPANSKVAIGILRHTGTDPPRRNSKEVGTDLCEIR